MKNSRGATVNQSGVEALAGLEALQLIDPAKASIPAIDTTGSAL
jgi:hypothetical protein